jgi:hypothetical protein
MRIENLPFRLESELVKKWYRLCGLRPSSEPYVSGDSFRHIADHVVEKGSQTDPSRIRSAEVVFVQSSEIGRFLASILPDIVAPFVLITHNGDLNIDQTFSTLAADARLLRWFAQNALFRHPKLTAIPIGLENRFLHCNGVVGDFNRLADRTAHKKNRILYGFTVGNNPKERIPAQDALLASPLADAVPRLNSRAYRGLLERYGFVASPPGNGIDCHRTWEALYLGVVPILKKSPFYDHFPGLPALFVNDWAEILDWDEAYLSQSRDFLSSRIESCSFLRFDYWLNLLRHAQRLIVAGKGLEENA